MDSDLPRQSEGPDQPTGAPAAPAPAAREHAPEIEIARGIESRAGAPGMVVGLGASAGGLRPLEDFFRAVPTDTGCAFVVVQHLSPDFKSLMQELLERCTSMPVERVEDGLELRADTVYLIPPKKNMRLADGRLHLHEQDRAIDHRPNFPIDMFLESMAEELGPRAVAIVLSGTGSDGTRGCRAINEAGGIVLVQDPATAQFDGMPRSAIGTGLADRVEAPSALAAIVHECVTRLGEGGEPTVAEGDEGVRHGSDAIARILRVMEQQAQIDFGQYKPSTIGRRIERRRLIVGQPTLEAYVSVLESSAAEREALQNDLLITVTSFFRDPSAWHVIASEALPELLHASSSDEPFRIWISACATGEEAYSMAMLVQETMERERTWRELKIFATDLDQGALERASAGVFPRSIEADLSDDRLKRFFHAREGRYEVSRELREKIIFAPHNLATDAPFTRMHLVSCRNVLIYMQPELQLRVLRTLHFALRRRGVLFLGSADALASLESEFAPVDRRWKIYTKKRDVKLPASVGQGAGPGRPRPVLADGRSSPAARGAAQAREALLASVLAEVLQDQSAVCLLVDGDGQLIEAHGAVDGLLRVPSGTATSNVARLLPPSLQLPVQTAVARAARDHGPTTYRGLQFDRDGEILEADVHVRPRRSEPGDPPSLLVTIMPSRRPASATGSATGGGPGGEDGRYDVGEEAAQRIRDLELELQQTRESLQATIEELETTNEEQQAGNEELLASNEELQSTNEELHSLNEELYTVNAEYQAKIQELTELHHDMDNLLMSTNIGTIFLDRELKVRKFTPAATEAFNLVEIDIGRPIEHLSHTLEYPTIFEDLRRVLLSGRPIERESTTRLGKPLLVRIHPYRTENDRQQGVVVTFIEIGELKRVERALERRAEELARANEELDRFNRLAVGREERIVDLKRQINALSDDLGRPKPFDLSFLEEGPADPPTGEGTPGTAT